MIGLMIGAPDVFPSPNSVIRRTSEPPDAVEASDAGRGPDICCPQSWVRGSLLLTSVCFASSSFCSKHPLLHHLLVNNPSSFLSTSLLLRKPHYFCRRWCSHFHLIGDVTIDLFSNWLPLKWGESERTTHLWIPGPLGSVNSIVASSGSASTMGQEAISM